MTYCIACGSPRTVYAGEGSVWDNDLMEEVPADKYECTECGCVWDE